MDALRGRTPNGQMSEQDAGSAARESGSAGMAKEAPAAPADEATAEEEDAMLADSGMGGQYEPLLEDEPRGSGSGDPMKVAEVHFNSGSAELTPGGERKARAAAEQIRSMDAAKVRVVAFADRVGDSASNLVLSQERALSIAAVLESVGLPRNMVEVVGSGEDGIPEPTADGIPEPLNRCAGIFVIADSAG
jgi:outer membrane protein OmpA-like peptidoglycan-associated protein